MSCNMEPHIAARLKLDVEIIFRQKYRGTLKHLKLDLDIFWRKYARR